MNFVMMCRTINEMLERLRFRNLHSRMLHMNYSELLPRRTPLGQLLLSVLEGDGVILTRLLVLKR